MIRLLSLKLILTRLPMRDYLYAVKRLLVKEDEKFIALIEKMQYSSGLVIAMSTYTFNVSSNLKIFIDRMNYVALDDKNLNILKQ